MQSQRPGGSLARWLGVESSATKKTLAHFGARELLAGSMLLRGTAVTTSVWNRVIGDGMDLAALGLAFTRSNRKAALVGAVAFVGGATILDALTARGLDRETGRTLPAKPLPA